MARRKRSHSRKRKSTRRRKAAVVAVDVNPPRRRRRSSRKSSRRYSRRYRRNPGQFLPSTASMFDAVYVTGGFIGTKLLANTIVPMVGIQMPILRIGAKVVLAGLLGWGGGKVLGRSNGQYLMIGGLVEAVNDAVQTYVTPFVPQLAVSSYPELSAYPSLSAYPELAGMVTEDTMETV